MYSQYCIYLKITALVYNCVQKFVVFTLFKTMQTNILSNSKSEVENNSTTVE